MLESQHSGHVACRDGVVFHHPVQRQSMNYRQEDKYNNHPTNNNNCYLSRNRAEITRFQQGIITDGLMPVVSLELFFPNDVPNFLKICDLYLVTQTQHLTCNYLTKKLKHL